ncbi:hypothetical protein HERIO_509 [Hepatospora eriocheir]|uniref:Uncharacterized protein n=1 Tax=Hepatospora eriocheir TaxID=1081669 RepID=A0A1X0QCZ6_9MICR|nr:hypothetical protein HERIO_509 [Hepatospora eriocheir]
MCMLEIKEEDERCLPEIKAWIIYYSKEEFTIFNKDINNVLKAIKLLEQTANLEEIKKSKIFYCDYLLYKKIGSIKCICCAISEILYISYSELIEIETRIVNVEKSESFEFVKPENEGKIISITGTIC